MRTCQKMWTSLHKGKTNRKTTFFKNIFIICFRHPYSGEYNVLDIKTKVNRYFAENALLGIFSNQTCSLITPERAKKITAAVSAVNETGKVVAQTTKSWGN